MEIDYRQLLKKYMRIVLTEEGVSFVPRGLESIPQPAPDAPPTVLSQEEFVALWAIHEEVVAEP